MNLNQQECVYSCDLKLVSVIIPLYNREKTIQRAIDSVLNQTYTNIEVLVVDDGSSDNSVQMLNKYKRDERVKVFYQSRNKGANAARNRGIKEAKGDYIAFQDSDDMWLPDKLEKQIRYMEKENFYVSFCAYQRYYGDAIQIVPNISEQLNSEDIREKLKRRNIIGTPTLVIHKSVVFKVGMFDEEMPRLQDYEYIIRIIKKFNVCFVNEALVMEYELDDCISRNQKNLHQAYALLVKKHADFIDVDFIWGEYLNTGSEIEKAEVDWSSLDKYIDDVIKDNYHCTKERLYKATIQQLNLKYNRLKQYEAEKYKILLDELKYKKFVIYGAGNYARKTLTALRKINLMPESFLVTNKDGTESMGEIPVIQLSEWDDKEVMVIIAVTGNAQIDIIKSLIEKGMYHYCIYPECI